MGASGVKPNKPVISSSIAVAFKRALTPTEDVEEAKRQHRGTLKTLVDTYLTEVKAGKVDGIRNAKDLVDVIKMDMLLLGEATERTEDVNSLDEIRVNKISQALDEADPAVQALINNVMTSLNSANDDADTNVSKPMDADADEEVGKATEAKSPDDSTPQGDQEG